MKEKTCALIKPDAVVSGYTGAIISRIEQEGFTIIRMEKRRLSREAAEQFYAVHRGRPFFESLVTDICASPLIVLMLERENAIQKWRDVMGATDPAKAAENTIRKLYGKSLEEGNATHGSDSPENAAVELALLFANT